MSVLGCFFKLKYVFILQSVKMLVGEWSRGGRVVWCDTRPLVKEQLSSVIADPICCDKDQLLRILTGNYIFIKVCWEQLQ